MRSCFGVSRLDAHGPPEVPVNFEILNTLVELVNAGIRCLPGQEVRTALRISSAEARKACALSVTLTHHCVSIRWTAIAAVGISPGGNLR